MRHSSKHGVAVDTNVVPSRPAAGAAADIKRRRRRTNNQPRPQHHSSALGIGIIATQRWGHHHHPHQPNVPLAKSKPQPYGDNDKHAGRLAGGPPQDNLPFGARTSPTTTATTTRYLPRTVATAPAPCHVHRRDDHNVSNNASGAVPTSHLPRWTADGTPSHVPRQVSQGDSLPPMAQSMPHPHLHRER